MSTAKCRLFVEKQCRNPAISAQAASRK
ncbi:MAG: hypothetical protein RIS36_1015, partial [Pseudomonadota bacterium]